MSLDGALTAYLHGLLAMTMVLAVLIIITGLDDLFIDVVYWLRALWRAVTVYRRHAAFDASDLLAQPEQPLVIMVPAWQEHGVIGAMAELAAKTLDYENYHIFVGTYPNDPQTQSDVDQVCARFPNVHKVICARPGPTSKADCLNNVLDAIFQFEQRSGMQFSGFILHDSEDVLASMELRLFNCLVGRKDLIQVPVYPLERPWREFTGGHYVDEFAETHGKDLVVREALAGQVPSAGVGTCFSRHAVLALLEEGDGIAFDVQSLTEDYDIGVRLKVRGMKEAFVRVPTLEAPAGDAGHPFGQRVRDASVISVREYFPDRWRNAVRQKSRWIIGIVFQGFKRHRWTRSPILNYFLWRDRKGALVNLISFLATLVTVQFLLLWLAHALAPERLSGLGAVERSAWLNAMLAISFWLIMNRLAQRMIFVTRYYGLRQGVLAIPRIVWANAINFMATWRAVALVWRLGVRRVAWDKTSHDFPSLGDAAHSRKPLGRILVEQGSLSEAQLEAALRNGIRGLRLGSQLIHQGLISTQALARAVAEQGGVQWTPLDVLTLPQANIALLPAAVALHYGVLALREDGQTMVLASENHIDPVSLAALSRKLKRQVRYVIVPKGQVTVGLREWYARRVTPSPKAMLDQALQERRLQPTQARSIWDEYVARQLRLGEILLALGRIDGAALGAVLLRHEQSELSLGEFLVQQGVLTQAELDEALQLQEQFQPSMAALLEGVVVPPPLASADEPPPVPTTNATPQRPKAKLRIIYKA